MGVNLHVLVPLFIQMLVTWGLAGFLKTTRVLFVIFRGLLMKCFAAPRGVSLRQSIFVSLVFSLVLSGREVRWFTGNRKILSIIRNGSMKRDLHEISLSIFKLVAKWH